MKQILKEYKIKVHEVLSNNINEIIDFMIELLDENDWSFIIKSHALIETVLSEYLTAKSGNEELNKIFRRLDMGNREIGKLEFAKAFNILSEEQRNFLRNYSTLRNNVVHNVENLKFNFQDFIINLDKQQLKSWKSCVLWFVKDEKSKSLWETNFLKQTKYTIWISIFMLIPRLSMEVLQEKELSRINKVSKSFIHVDDLLDFIKNVP